MVFFPFFGSKTERAVTHGAVDHAIGPKGEAIEVVSAERNAHAETVLDDVFLVGYAIAVVIA